jgi:hypothetical protein
MKLIVVLVGLKNVKNIVGEGHAVKVTYVEENDSA